jgi:hypothetical protein
LLEAYALSIKAHCLAKRNFTPRFHQPKHLNHLLLILSAALYQSDALLRKLVSEDFEPH